MSRKGKKRSMILSSNRQRLEELFRNHPAALPEVEVIEFCSTHLRLTCDGRSFDYWPSTGRVWETGSCRSSMRLTVDELWSLVIGDNQLPATKRESRWQRSSEAEHERRVHAFLSAGRH